MGDGALAASALVAPTITDEAPALGAPTAPPLVAANAPALAADIDLQPPAVVAGAIELDDAATADAPSAATDEAPAPGTTAASATALPVLDATHGATDELPPLLTAAHAHGASAEERSIEPGKAELAHAAPAPEHAADDRAAEILRQVRVQLAPQLRHAVIQLSPAELGQIAIELRVERDGVVAHVRAEKRVALEALERHLPELRAALARHGLETQRVDLALGFDDRRGGAGARESAAERWRGARAGAADGATTTIDAAAPLARWIRADGVDTYA